MAFVEFPSYRAKDASQRAIVAFLVSVEKVLDDIATAANEMPQAFPGNLAGLIQPAWNEARGQLAEMREAVSGLSNSTIHAHGLAGAQLAFKLAVVRNANLPFRGAENYLLFGLPEKLRKLLEYIDILFESLVDALGLGDGVKELKAYIEGLLED